MRAGETRPLRPKRRERAKHAIVAIAIGMIALISACKRAPEEPAASDSATPNDSQSHGTATTKTIPSCLRPTPDAPPPPVAPGPALGCPLDPEHGATLFMSVVVSLPDAINGATKVTAEYARTEEENERGLMYRTHLDEDRGMLFDVRGPRDVTFWMHNTCIPLDLIFIDGDTINGIVENAPTLDDHPRSPGCPSTHVFEVNAGWCRRHGVKAGQHIVFPRS
jgi:hypothetical protein